MAEQLFKAVTISDQPFEQVVRAGVLHKRLLANLKAGVMAVMSEAEVKVFHALCVHADWVACMAWPSVATLIEETGLGRSSIYKALADLQHRAHVIVKRSRSYCRRDGSAATGSAYEIVVTLDNKVRRGGKSAATDFPQKSAATDEYVPPDGQESPRAAGPELCIDNSAPEPVNVFSTRGARENQALATASQNASAAPTFDSLDVEDLAALKSVALSLIPEDARSILNAYDPTHPALRPVLERYLREGRL